MDKARYRKLRHHKYQITSDYSRIVAIYQIPTS